MKHIRNFEGFKEKRKNQVVSENVTNYYYKLGKSCNKSIFEMELVSEGYSIEFVNSINESLEFSKIDNKIIDCVWEYLQEGTETKLDLLTEELTVFGKKVPTLGDMYNGVSNLVDKGIEIGKSAISSFKDFIKNIGNIVKNLFSKIKAFFAKVWEAFKPKLTAAMGVIKKAVGGGSTDKMKGAVDAMSSDNGQQEISSLSEDLSKVCGKFSSGNVGNMSEESAKHLQDEAGEYKGIEDDAEIEKLMQESLERKTSVGKIYYSIKGFLSEGGRIDELDAVFEAEETEKVALKEGDKVTYTSKDGKKVTKSILRIEGDNAVFTSDKDGSEFTKPVSDLEKPGEGAGKKVLSGFVGAEPEKKGVFGWLVESVGFVFNPLVKVKETLIKGGTNGICMMISAIARGLKNMAKYITIGVIAGLVYHIVHGLMTLAGGHGEGHDEKGEGHGEKGGHGGEVKAEVKPEVGIGQKVGDAAKEFVKDPATQIAAGAAVGAAAVGAIKGKKTAPGAAKESLSINESDEALTVDMTKNSPHTSGILDSVKKLALPAVGGLLMAALSHFFPIVHTILEGILVSIGIFELVGAVCQLESIKSKNFKVCTLQHKAHHFIEGGVGGGH
jgi:hypothetical protein